MKAITYTQYGPADVLQLSDVAKPEPKDDQVQIRVCAASLNPLDWHYLRGTPYFLRLESGIGKPKNGRLGVDASGVVATVGKSVTRFKPGDEVFGTCKGACAEYACASERKLVHKPGNVTFEQAAAVPIAALTALQGLRDKGQIRTGQKVLINGASGGVGTFAVQIARTLGAEVTGVCSSRNVEMVRSIGADHVVDYTMENFTQSGQQYDLILDCAGSHSLADTRRALTADGTLVMVGGPVKGNWVGPMLDVLGVVVLARFTRHKLRPFIANINSDDLVVLQQKLEDGSVTPVIDRSYPLHEVPEAVRYLGEGHARGKIVVTLQE